MLFSTLKVYQNQINESEDNELNVYGSPYGWGLQLKINAIAHLAATIGNIITVEGVTNISDDIDLGNYKLDKAKLIPSSLTCFGMKLLVKDF